MQRDALPGRGMTDFHGSRKMSCVPMRRQMMCGSPGVTDAPYEKVARQSGAHVIS